MRCDLRSVQKSVIALLLIVLLFSLLAGCGGEEEPTPSPFEEVDEQLRNSMRGSIAYAPQTSMIRGEPKEFALRISPSTNPEELEKELLSIDYVDTDTFDIRTAKITVTPFMLASLLDASNGEAFDITPHHNSPVQPLSSIESTNWTWTVTPKKGGNHQLILIMHRLVELDDEDPFLNSAIELEEEGHWRRVQEYQDIIDVEVTLPMRVKDFGSGLWDAKFWLGPLLALLAGVAGKLIYDSLKEKSDSKAKAR